MPMNQIENLSARIPGISHHIRRTELTRRKPSFPQHVRCPLGIMDVTRTNVGCDWQFVLTVNQQMQLPAISQFFGALSSHLDRPTRLWVGLWGLTPIAPTFQRRAIQCDPFAKPRQGFVVFARQGPRHVFNPWQGLGELPEEPTEGGFMGDVGRRCDATGFSNERVIVQSPNHRCGGRMAKRVLHYEATPEGFDRVPFRATANGALQGCQKGRILKRIKDRLEFGNDRGMLYRDRNSGTIRVGHGKKRPSCWLGDVGASNTCVPVPISKYYTKG